MPTDQHIKKLAGRIVTLYRNHCGLFWRIMMPVAVITIILEIALFFYTIPQFEKDISNWRPRNGYTVTSKVNTVGGIDLTIADTTENLITDAMSSPVWSGDSTPSRISVHRH